MFLKFFLPLLVISFKAAATTLQASYHFKTYQIDIRDEAIIFNSKDLNVKIEKKECNQHIIRKFITKFDKNISLKKDFIDGSLTNKDNLVTYNLNGKIHRTKTDEKLGRFIVLIPYEMKRMKLEEKLICNRNKRIKWKKREKKRSK